MIFQSICFGLLFWFVTGMSMFFFIPYYILRLFRQEKRAHFYIGALGRIWSRMFIFLSGSKVHIEGQENIPRGRPYCFISNHQAYMDILVFMASARVAPGYIAKKSLSMVPFIRTWMFAFGCYFLKRNSLKDGMKAILFGVDRVKKGYPMVIFPEGTRSKQPQMREFKKGGLKLATKAKALAVPVSIEGTYNVLEARGYVKPSWLAVKFHPPIDAAHLTSEEENQLADRLHQTIQTGVYELHAKTPKYLR